MRGYSLSEVLLDTPYRGSRGYGRIIHAEKREDVYSADHVFLVQVEPTDHWGTRIPGGNTYYATVFIDVES
jgi:hypothetical protein